MKPTDFSLTPEEIREDENNKKESRKQREEDISIPDDNYSFVITKHAPNDKFASTIDFGLEIDEGFYKGSKITSRFSMVKKDGSSNIIAKRIYNDICKEVNGGYMPNEFYEMLGKKITLRYKRTVTEKGVYHNVSVPYKPKLKVAPLAIGEPIPSAPIEEIYDQDVPF